MLTAFQILLFLLIIIFGFGTPKDRLTGDRWYVLLIVSILSFLVTLFI